MKVCKVTWRNKSYMDKRFADAPQMAAQAYETLRQFVYADFMGTSDAWGDGLRRLGVDAIDVPLRIGQLEKAWWAEFGSAGALPSSDEITAAVLKQQNPDVLIVEGLEKYQASELRRFHEWLPNLKVLAASSGNEILDPEIFRELDLFFSIRPVLVKQAQDAGCAAYRIANGFDDRILPLIGETEHSNDFVFCGTIHPGEKYHEERRRILEEVCKANTALIYTDSNLSFKTALPEYVVKLGAFAVAHTLSRLGVPLDKMPGGAQLQTARSWSRPPEFNWSPAIARAARPAVFGLDMFRTLASARVTINVQPGNADRYATNMRLLEATGVGTCLVCDTAVDMDDFFADDEIVTFSSADEAVEKVKYLIDHPHEAEAIGERGKSRTMKDHTYATRMRLVGESLSSALSASRGRQ